MKKARAKPSSRSSKKVSAAGSGTRKAADLEALRERIIKLVAGKAYSMVSTTITEVNNKGNVQALKFLFEMIGLYPATAGPEEGTGGDALARTLLQRLGVPEDAMPEEAVTKESAEPVPVAGDAVE